MKLGVKKFKFTRNIFVEDDETVFVDQCDGLIYKGCEHMKSDAVFLRSYVSHKSSNSILHEVDSNVKFSLTCNKEKVLYAKNPHYGWQLCTVA